MIVYVFYNYTFNNYKNPVTGYIPLPDVFSILIQSIYYDDMLGSGDMKRDVSVMCCGAQY